uniref:Uncharacterized protein n=1 Tax=Solanum lycopersicum TaxID=4081 RepID=A0A3Q7GKH8_SOLLC
MFSIDGYALLNFAINIFSYPCAFVFFLDYSLICTFLVHSSYLNLNWIIS